MRISLKNSLLAVCAVVALAVCSPSYALLITTAAYNPGTTASYGAGPWDYQSLPDTSGFRAGVNGGVLNTVTIAQGAVAPGAPNIMSGLAEAFTPRTTNTGYGAPNNHSFKLNTITVPIGGGNPALVGPNGVTLKVYQPTSFSGGGLNASDSAFNFDGGAGGTVLYSTQFDWVNTGNQARLVTFDLQGAGPAIAAGTSYALAFEWNNGQGVTQDSLVWYRLADASTADAINAGPTNAPSGQGYRLVAAGTGYQTITATGGAGGAPRTFAMALGTIPEPGTLCLFALGALFIAGKVRRRSN